MSEKVSQLFKDWMIAAGKSKNTASNYFTGVNIVSKHCGREVFEITDLDELERLYRLYGAKGEYAEVGASNSGNVHSGLRQWLDYQQRTQQGQVGSSSINPIEGRKQWERFLARWPVSKLIELTLEQYYGAEGDDSFFSWMRDHTKQLGYFQEGVLSAGIRPRGRNAKNEPGPDMQTDGRYLWYSILGNSAQEAFERLKAELLTAVDAVQQGDLSLMAGLKDAPGALEWKVAFLYQNQAQPLVLPFYTQKQLKRIAGPNATGATRQLQQQLLARRGEKDILEFAVELERMLMSSAIVNDEKESSYMSQTAVALNQILFGPPGTGKTYATIEAALEVLDSRFLQDHSQDRVALKQRFDQLADEGRIRFVTFHQSFSYEDFVEGLRAENDEATGQLRYETVDGVFKSLCEVASVKVTQQAVAPLELGERKVWKMSLGNTVGSSDASIYEECVQGGYMLLGYGDGLDFSGCKNRSDVKQRLEEAGVTLDGPSDYNVTSVTTFVTKMKIGDLVVVSDGNFKFRAIGEITGGYAFKPHPDYEDGYAQMRPVKWLRQYRPSLPHGELLNAQFSQMTLYELRSPTLNREKLKALLGTPEVDSGSLLYVGQRFGQGYVVRSIGPEVVEFDKPRGGVLPLPLSLLRQLLAYVRSGQIDVDDIRQGRVFEKVAEAELEKYIVNGYQSLFAAMVEQLIKQQEGTAATDARVLIIDEINRGNVSRIFGELITLIEPSKRAGAEEALSVVLPYSKQRFSVPSNVYLIGTMNTADRSLAGLDIALRRRFTFKEMPPRPDLLDHVLVEDAINVGELLRVINQRIEVLLNREHCLGHAYFMPLRDEPTLARLALIFRNQVLPLLQEYFFEDWQRIQWVLNDHRKADADRFLCQQSNNMPALFGPEVNIGPSGQTWHVSEEAFERLEAYLGIIDPLQVSTLASVKREAIQGELTLRELTSGTVEVWRAGVRQVPSMPLLRTVAGVLGISPLNAQGNALNTRSLGCQLITRLLVKPA